MGDVRVVPFLVSELRLPPDEQEALGREWWPSYAHAVIHGEGVFLFDNGVGMGNAEIERAYAPRVTPIEDALARHGVSLADVTGAANCHLHLDHSGQNVRLPKGVPIFVQRREWERVREPDYTVPEWIDAPGLVYEVIDGEIEHLAGVGAADDGRAGFGVDQVEHPDLVIGAERAPGSRLRWQFPPRLPRRLRWQSASPSGRSSSFRAPSPCSG